MRIEAVSHIKKHYPRLHCSHTCSCLRQYYKSSLGNCPSLSLPISPFPPSSLSSPPLLSLSLSLFFFSELNYLKIISVIEECQ